MRGVLAVCVVVFAVSVIACGGKVTTNDPVKPKEEPKVRAEPKEEQPSPLQIKAAGRVKLNQILAEYHDPAKNPNRAAIAKKYFDQYWEVDLTGYALHVQEDHIQSGWAFKPGIHTTLHFRDNADLLKFNGKPTDPKLIIGKATAENRFVDCFIPEAAK